MKAKKCKHGRLYQVPNDKQEVKCSCLEDDIKALVKSIVTRIENEKVTKLITDEELDKAVKAYVQEHPNDIVIFGDD